MKNIKQHNEEQFIVKNSTWNTDYGDVIYAKLN